jgi:hypothetical protein
MIHHLISLYPGMGILEIGPQGDSPSGMLWGGHDFLGLLVTTKIAFRAKRFGQKETFPFLLR